MPELSRKDVKLRRVSIVRNVWADDLNMKMWSAYSSGKEGEEKKRKGKKRTQERGRTFSKDSVRTPFTLEL